MNYSNINWAELHRLVERYKKADVLSAYVGMVLVPVLFLGAGVSCWLFLSDPFRLWITATVVVAGLLLFIFILRYLKRTRNNPGYLMQVSGIEFLTISSNSLDRAYTVKLNVDFANTITQEGKGVELPDMRGTSVRKVVISYKLFEALKQNRPALIACVPGGPCIAFITSDGIFTDNGIIRAGN